MVMSSSLMCPPKIRKRSRTNILMSFSVYLEPAKIMVMAEISIQRERESKQIKLNRRGANFNSILREPTRRLIYRTKNLWSNSTKLLRKLLTSRDRGSRVLTHPTNSSKRSPNLTCLHLMASLLLSTHSSLTQRYSLTTISQLIFASCVTCRWFHNITAHNVHTDKTWAPIHLFQPWLR